MTVGFQCPETGSKPLLPKTVQSLQHNTMLRMTAVGYRRAIDTWERLLRTSSPAMWKIFHLSMSAFACRYELTA